MITPVAHNITCGECGLETRRLVFHDASIGEETGVFCPHYEVFASATIGVPVR